MKFWGGRVFGIEKIWREFSGIGIKFLVVGGLTGGQQFIQMQFVIFFIIKNARFYYKLLAKK